jgi:hypothetical protein
MNAQAVENDAREVREWINRQEARPFGETHPIRIDMPDGGPPLRFASLKCAARTAVDRNLSVWDEDHAVGYSAADCYRIANGL